MNKVAKGLYQFWKLLFRYAGQETVIETAGQITVDQ